MTVVDHCQIKTEHEEAEYGEIDTKINNSVVKYDPVKADSEIKLDSEYDSDTGANKETPKALVSVRESNTVVSSIPRKGIHRRIPPITTQVESGPSEVIGWITRDSYILCPECGYKLEVICSVIEHMKTHNRLPSLPYSCLHCRILLNKEVFLTGGRVLHHMHIKIPFEVKCWIARENNILCPECGFELDITRPISEHMETHYQLNSLLYCCIHCCKQLNKKVVLQCNQVLRHMQMCHGFCFLPELFIEHSAGMDRIICPACPKGKGGNKVVVGWDNLERHFRKVHTNSPEMIKLICQGCGSISVHLKDVHKHKTCRLQEFAKKELPSSVLPSHDHKQQSLKLLGSSFVESQCYSPAQGNSAVPDKSNCDSSGKVNIVSRDFDLKRIKSNESEKPSKRRKFGQNTPQTVGRQTI